jgi:Fur family ferric uptake transcriptional regulator
MRYEDNICKNNKCPEKVKCDVKLRRYISSSGGRLTRERLILMQAICVYKGHFTPDELAKFLGQRGQAMALTTIYRNLPALEGAGIICRTTFSEEQTRGAVTYERVVGKPHHDHLVCKTCGKKVEFEYDAIEILQQEIARQHGFQLISHHLELVGICKKCQEK